MAESDIAIWTSQLLWQPGRCSKTLMSHPVTVSCVIFEESSLHPTAIHYQTICGKCGKMCTYWRQEPHPTIIWLIIQLTIWGFWYMNKTATIIIELTNWVKFYVLFNMSYGTGYMKHVFEGKMFWTINNGLTTQRLKLTSTLREDTFQPTLHNHFVACAIHQPTHVCSQLLFISPAVKCFSKFGNSVKVESNE